MIPEKIRFRMEMPADLFLLPCKAAELADSLIITDLGEVLLAGAGEK